MYVPLPEESLQINTPVPVNVWDPYGKLLLRRGEAVESERHREYLLMHSPVVKESDFKAWTYSYTTELDRMVRNNQPLNEIAGLTRPAELGEAADVDDADPITAWPDLHAGLAALLHQNVQSQAFTTRMRSLERKSLKLLQARPDDTLFMLAQLLFDRNLSYGAAHAWLSAACAYLVAPAVRLSEDDQLALFRAAMTMNMGMAKLQDDLARQELSLSDWQRREIAAHPQRSANMLRELGVTDPLWLALVTHHHLENGEPALTGPDVSVAARLLHMADVFVARIGHRRTRRGILPHMAAKDIYLNAQGEPNELGAAFVKTIGIYPPGTYVRLACGEVAVVVRRGRRANAPVVFSIVGKQGMPLGEPALRDTLDRLYEVKGGVLSDEIKVIVNPARLFSRV